MKLKSKIYLCAKCDSFYELPIGEGEIYLLYTDAGEVTSINYTNDPILSEFTTLLIAHPIAINYNPDEITSFFKKLYGVLTCDLSISGRSYSMIHEPICPNCGSVEKNLEQLKIPLTTDDYVDLLVEPASHKAWFLLSEPEKNNLIEKTILANLEPPKIKGILYNTSWQKWVFDREKYAVNHSTRLKDILNTLKGDRHELLLALDFSQASVIIGEELLYHDYYNTLKWFDLLLPVLSRVKEVVNPHGNYSLVKDLIGFIMLAQSVGKLNENDLQSDIQSWISKIIDRPEPVDNSHQIKFALLATAFSMNQAARKLISKHVVHGTNNFNESLPNLCNYLLNAIEYNATLSTVEPVWNKFLQQAPYLFKMDKLHFSDIHVIARIVLCRIGGLPVAKLSEELHKQVKLLAAK